MKMMKKTLALLLAMVLVLGLAACGGEQAPENPTVPSNSVSSGDTTPVPDTQPQSKDPVTIKWYYRGNGLQKDTEAVQDYVNSLLKEYPGLEHVSIELCCYTSDEYQTAVNNAFIAETQIDIFSTVNVGDWKQMAVDGYFMELDNLLTAELKEALPAWLLELGKVGEHNYIIPTYQNAGNNNFMLIPNEYLKYADKDLINTLKTSTDIHEICDALKQFVLDVRAGTGKDTKWAYSVGNFVLTNNGSQGFPFSQIYGCYDIYNDHFIVDSKTGKVEFRLTTDYAKDLYAEMAEWYAEGILHPDIATVASTDYTMGNMMNDASYCWSNNGNIGDEAYTNAQYSASFGFDTTSVLIQPQFFTSNNWAAGGNGNSSTCKNPQEAIAFLSAINGGSEQGKKIYNAIVFGLEGTHYTVDANDPNRIVTKEYDGSQGGADTSYAGLKWIIGNTFNAYKNQAIADDWAEVVLAMNEDPNNLSSILPGFVLDSSKVSNQIANVRTVVDEYAGTLFNGVKGADWEATYTQFETALKAAGVEEIIAEYQAQIDAFLK